MAPNPPTGEPENLPVHGVPRAILAQPPGKCLGGYLLRCNITCRAGKIALLIRPQIDAAHSIIDQLQQLGPDAHPRKRCGDLTAKAATARGRSETHVNRQRPRKSLISSMNRSNAGSLSSIRWFLPGIAIKRAPGMPVFTKRWLTTRYRVSKAHPISCLTIFDLLLLLGEARPHLRCTVWPRHIGAGKVSPSARAKNAGGRARGVGPWGARARVRSSAELDGRQDRAHHRHGASKVQDWDEPGLH